MSGFPSLQPAFTVSVTIDAPIGVGSASRGTAMNVAPMTDITIKSEADFHPALDAQLQGTANDYIHNDPGGKHMRLNAHGQVKDKSSGGLVYVSYTGVVNITPELGAILTGKEGAKSTDFGDSFIEMHFETGEEKLKELESSMFAGAGRFVVEQGKPVVVEYKVSKLVKGK